jgi:hypothetical protein
MKMKRQKKNCYRLLMMLAVVFFALDVLHRLPSVVM